jgi:hypothetical protein
VLEVRRQGVPYELRSRDDPRIATTTLRPKGGAALSCPVRMKNVRGYWTEDIEQHRSLPRRCMSSRTHRG